MEVVLTKADAKLFSVYQTMYSGADIEMWYDFARRLEDTLWTDQCYFLESGGEKIGGAIITDGAIMYPFLVLPYADRAAFWRVLLEQMPRQEINGILDIDSVILPMFGYKALSTRQVMCRPADAIEAALPNGFALRAFDMDGEAEAIADVIRAGYAGGIDYELYGEATRDEAIEDARRVLGVYAPKNLSHVAIDDSGEIAGVCLAGIGDKYTLGYVEIADICVVPGYRGRGLAKCMIARILKSAHGIAPFVKLCVTVGNRAEYLYRQMGFIPGPRFTNFTKR